MRLGQSLTRRMTSQWQEYTFTVIVSSLTQQPAGAALGIRRHVFILVRAFREPTALPTTRSGTDLVIRLRMLLGPLPPLASLFDE